MTILQLIASDGFITVNKELIKLVGLEEAIIFGELASEWDYWQKRNEIYEGWFFSTIENIEDKTTLSEHKQRKAINKLKELKLIDVMIKGLPAKRYIKINTEAVKDLLLNPLRTSSVNSQELDTEKLQGNNNIINNNISNNNIDNIDSKESNSKEIKDISSSKKSSKENKSSSSKKISRKEQITDYINSLEYNSETKDYLFKWLFSIGLTKGVSLAQFTDMIKNLWEECNDESILRESVKKSYLNNWFGFYSNKKMTQNVQTHSINQKVTIEPTQLNINSKPLLSPEVF